MKKVAIIGGGVTGLAAAYSIKKATKQGADIDYILLEKDDRLGGKVDTRRTDDGFVVEGGPDCFVSTKPQVFALAKELGFEDKMICSNEHLKGTYIMARGKLREMPEGIMLMVPTKVMPFLTTDLFTPLGKIRMAMDLLIPKKEPGDETLASFVSRRLGKEALDVLAEPLVAGVHASDPDTMSLAATFPNFLEMEQKYGSVIKGMLEAMKNRPGAPKPVGAGSVHAGAKGGQGGQGGAPRPKRTFFMSFKGGMKDLVEELYGQLDAGKVRTGSEVTSVHEATDPSGAALYKLVMADGTVVEADAVILASPSDSAADLVEGTDKALAAALREIPQTSSATVSMVFRKGDLKRQPKGFGVLVPSSEHRKIMAVTWSSNKWSYRVPGDEHVIIRAFVGGARHPENAFMEDDEMKATVLRELKQIAGIDATPVHTWIFRWIKGMPQYTIGHLDRMKRIDERVASHKGMFLAGGSYRGVGLPDCIGSGTKAAEAAAAYLARGPESATA